MLQGGKGREGNLAPLGKAPWRPASGGSRASPGWGRVGGLLAGELRVQEVGWFKASSSALWFRAQGGSPGRLLPTRGPRAREERRILGD